MAKILVAEDDRVVSLLICGMLKQQGYEVVAAFDAMQAMMLAIRPPQPDVITLDVQMPGGTGIEALRKLKVSTRTAMIPVIIVSGSASAQQRQELAELGAGAYLEKPVDRDALLAAVAAAVGPPPR
ncbi:MAG: response regulator [Gemmatimonadaceae bacterium]|nr:response regulator [Gemmatimonadaceae bacterium]